MDDAYTGESSPWWAVLLYGVLMIILGIFLLVKPGLTAATIVWFIGVWWLVTGAVALLSLFHNRAHWIWKTLSGLLGIVVGGWIVATPFVDGRLGVATTTLTVLSAFVLVWAISGIIGGVGQLIAAFQGGGWGIGLMGALWIFISLFLLFNLFLAAAVLPWVYGIFAIAGGIVAVIVSFRVRKVENTPAVAA